MTNSLEAPIFEGVKPELLSSAEVARMLGVSAASIKRWADAGVLPCEKTAGLHRRFRRDVVDRFRHASAPPGDAGGTTLGGRDGEAWADDLLDFEQPEYSLVGNLMSARGELGSWWRVADRLGPALTALGRRWQRDQITVADEHRASERFSRVIARVCEWMPTHASPPRCLLAAATGDEHTLGLSLVELCLRERAWAPVWIGRSAPLAHIAEAVARYDVRLVALSASSVPHGSTLRDQAERLGLACSAHGVQLVLGGSGAWPERPVYGSVVRDFGTFSELLATLS